MVKGLYVLTLLPQALQRQALSIVYWRYNQLRPIPRAALVLRNQLGYYLTFDVALRRALSSFTSSWQTIGRIEYNGCDRYLSSQLGWKMERDTCRHFPQVNRRPVWNQCWEAESSSPTRPFLCPCTRQLCHQTKKERKQTNEKNASGMLQVCWTCSGNFSIVTSGQATILTPQHICIASESGNARAAYFVQRGVKTASDVAGARSSLQKRWYITWARSADESTEIIHASGVSDDFIQYSVPMDWLTPQKRHLNMLLRVNIRDWEHRPRQHQKNGPRIIGFITPIDRVTL